MLGSPIRTPPDQRSVANSPGLIAGSYVLHRLLMPRHPPCALCSLSHKHSTKTTTLTCRTLRSYACDQHKRPDKHTPHLLEDVLSHLIALQTSDQTKAWIARCSRPLFNNQTPHPPTPPPRESAQLQRRRPSRRSCDPSGPNSVPSSPTPPAGQVPRPHPDPPKERTRARAVLRPNERCERVFIDDSTSEHHHTRPDTR